MISTVLLKICLTTLVSLIFYFIMCSAIYGGNWHRPEANTPLYIKVIGGSQILIILITFFAGTILTIWNF